MFSLTKQESQIYKKKNPHPSIVDLAVRAGALVDGLTFLVVSISLLRAQAIVHRGHDMIRLVALLPRNTPSMLETVADLVDGHYDFRLYEPMPVQSRNMMTDR